MSTKSKKPFYKSKTVMAVLAAVFCSVVLPALGYPLPEEYTRPIMTSLVGLIIIGLRDASGGGVAWKPGSGE